MRGLCRVMEYDRISSYQIEAFFTELARINLYKLCDYVVMPKCVHVSPHMVISVVVPELHSLHDLLHRSSMQRSTESTEGLSLSHKMDVLIELAKVLSQLHTLATPIAHGSINSHNIFIEFEQSGPGQRVPKVRIGELEMNDFKRYANMFYSYKCVTVCSPPECLE